MIGDFVLFFFQAEDGIRDLVRSRGLGDVYKRQDRKRVPRFSLDNLNNFVVGDVGESLGGDLGPVLALSLIHI